MLFRSQLQLLHCFLKLFSSSWMNVKTAAEVLTVGAYLLHVHALITSPVLMRSAPGKWPTRAHCLSAVCT